MRAGFDATIFGTNASRGLGTDVFLDNCRLSERYSAIAIVVDVDSRSRVSIIESESKLFRTLNSWRKKNATM